MTEKHCGKVGGDIHLMVKGGCAKPVELEKAYRCVGCGQWFHLDCLYNHFEQEEGNDNARFHLKKILDYADAYLPIGNETMQKKHAPFLVIKEYAEKGLERVKPTISFPNFK